MTVYEISQPALPLCACGQVGKTLVDNESQNWTAAMSFEKAKAFSNGDPVVDALVHAVDLLSARVEALELRFTAFVGILDRPLSPTESIEELRRLREGLADA